MLALMMIVSIFTIVPVTVSAETTYESGDYSYVLYTKDDDVTVAEITAYAGSDAELVIPDTLDGYTVNAIRREAFRRKSFLASVVFPDTVTADADGNGEPDITDATAIQRHLAAMKTPYPIGEKIVQTSDN